VGARRSSFSYANGSFFWKYDSRYFWVDMSEYMKKEVEIKTDHPWLVKQSNNYFDFVTIESMPPYLLTDDRDSLCNNSACERYYACELCNHLLLKIKRL
jgi:hypothetical protein